MWATSSQTRRHPESWRHPEAPRRSPLADILSCPEHQAGLQAEFVGLYKLLLIKRFVSHQQVFLPHGGGTPKLWTIVMIMKALCMLCSCMTLI